MPRALRSIYARLFSFSTVLISLLVLFVYILCIGRPLLPDPDIWWHLHNAQLLVQNRAFIRQDTYTYTVVGKPWINPEWLSELPYYFAWRWFGYRGLETVAIGALEAVVLGVCFLCWQRKRNVKSALLACILFLPMLSVSFGPRTLMFGWLCLIAETALLWEFRKGRDLLWSFPPLFLLWINLHGSWPVGILFFAIFIAAGLLPNSAQWGSILVTSWSPSQRSKLLWILAVSTFALFLNPYGWRLVAYPFHITLAHKLTLATVEEWQTLDFHSIRGKLVYTVLAGLLIANMVRKRLWPAWELIFILVAVLAAFTYTRFLVLAGILVSPLLAREFTFFRKSSADNGRPAANMVLIAAVIAIIATQLPSEVQLQTQVAEAYPAKAAAYLKGTKLNGRILNEFGWGGYLEWNAPSVPLFIDSRADIFDQYGVLQEYVDAASDKKPLEVINKYRIDYVLFPSKDPIVYLLSHTPGWSAEYQDDLAVLLERDRPE